MNFDDRRTIGRYRLIASIGRGGMGDVYLTVTHGQLGVPKLLVLKVLRADLAVDEKFRTMFLNEARLATQLNHPNIVQTIEVGEDDGLHYMTLEYLEGQPLHVVISRIGRDKLSLELHLCIFAQVLAGLHAAHELADFTGKPLDVVHRDVSPQNVIVTYDGQVKLVDFGVAKVAGADNMTETGVVKGKMAYMAPEQALSMPVDRRADLFAVGIMLWEAIAQERYVERGEEKIATIEKRITGDIRSLRSVAPDAPAELLAICDKAIARNKEDRYATAAEFQDALETYLQHTDPGAGQKQIGAVVAAAFAKERSTMRTRIEAQLTALADAPSKVALVDVPVTEADASGKHLAVITSGATAVTKIQPLVVQARSKAWPLALIAAVLASGAWIAFARKSAPVAPDPATSRIADVSASLAAIAPVADSVPPAPRLVRIRITAKPPTARVSLDGAPAVVAPLEANLTSDGKRHSLVVRAPGFLSETRELSSDRDVDLEIALSLVPTVTPFGKRRGAPATSGSNNARPLDDKDPYSQ
jgi:tRNA A-37 threonylcarbamoyl transferase component Bud32